MAIGIVNVVVPLSGDGAVVDISALVGEKTVVLSGTFRGRYILLGSHDDAHFVPVLIFDADGSESIKKTLPGAIKSVRVRAAATAPVGVTMNVSGITLPGNNQFTVVATLAVGASGLQPIIDLNVVFPATGLENDINFMCAGAFNGVIDVLGSLDGVRFNPIGSFRADPASAALLGGVTLLEFTPLGTTDQVRYIRLSVNAQLSATTVVTLGGEVPSAAAAAPKFISFSEDEGKVVIGVVEGIVYEWAVNLSDLPIGPNINVQLDCIAQALGGGTATFKVYLGSTTPGNTVGGTVRCTTNTLSAVEVILNILSAAFANPGGVCLLQLTAVGDGAAVQALIRAISINIG
jgi:hypothetical protein